MLNLTILQEVDLLKLVDIAAAIVLRSIQIEQTAVQGSIFISPTSYTHALCPGKLNLIATQSRKLCKF